MQIKGILPHGAVLIYTYYCDHEILLTFAAEAGVGSTVLVSACECCHG
jgi:3-methyladenine DNA glycosylase Mpg